MRKSRGRIKVNTDAVYACVNYGEAFCPGEIKDRSICIDSDIGEVQRELRNAGRFMIR